MTDMRWAAVDRHASAQRVRPAEALDATLEDPSKGYDGFTLACVVN